MTKIFRERYLLNLSCLFICATPASLITGPFLGDLFFTLSGIIFLILAISKKQYFYFTTIYFKIFIVWYFIILFSSFFSENILFSLESSLFYFRFIFGALSIHYLIKNNNKFIFYIKYSLLLTLSILLFDSYFQYIFGHNIINISLDMRLSSFFGEEKKLGSFLIRLSPLLFVLLLSNESQTNKQSTYKFLFYILIFFPIVVLTTERTAIFLTLIFTFLILVISIQSLKTFFLFFLSLIFFFISISFLSSDVRERVYANTYYEMFSKKPGFVIYSEQYNAHYKTAFKMFLDKPFMGHGSKMFRIKCDDEKYVNYFSHPPINGCSTHPHNTYLQLLSETGILGAFPIIFLFAIIVFRLSKNVILSCKRINYDNYQRKKIIQISTLYLIIFINLLPFSPSGNFFDNWLSIIYYFSIGFLLYILDENKPITVK